MKTLDELQEKFNSETTPLQRESFYALTRDCGIPHETLLRKLIFPTPLFPELGIQNFHGMYVAIMPNGNIHT